MITQSQNSNQEVRVQGKEVEAQGPSYAKGWGWDRWC